MSAPARNPWQYKELAKELHATHGYNPYTMDWNTSLMAEMRDCSLPAIQSVWAAIRYTSTGRLSDCCVDVMPPLKAGDPTPRKLLQADLVALTGRSPGTVSDACSKLREQKFLLPRADGLYPNDRRQLSLFEASYPATEPLQNQQNDPGVSSDSANYFAFSSLRDRWLKEHPDELLKLETIRLERERLAVQRAELALQAKLIERHMLAWVRDIQRAAARNGHGAVPDAAESESGSDPAAFAESVEPASHSAGAGSGSASQSFATPTESVRTPPTNPTAEIQTPPTPANVTPAESEPDCESLLKLQAFNSAAIVGQSVGEDRPTDTTPDAVHSMLLEELGEKLPHEVPSTRLCERIALGMGEVPLDHLRGKIRARRENVTWTTMGLVESFVPEVVERWRLDAAKRQAALVEVARQRERDRQAAARRDAEIRQHARDTLADPTSSDREKQLAREVLGEQAGGGSA